MNSKSLATLLFLAVLCLSLIPSQALAEGGKVGEPAVDFTLGTHDGKTLTLSKLKGKRAAVLVFFATWCPACMAEVPQVKAFTTASRNKKVLVYGVNVRQPERVVKRFVKSYEVNYRVLLDKEGSVTSSYEVTGIPLIVGIDGNGVIQYRGHSVPADHDTFIKTLTQGIGGDKGAATADGHARSAPSIGREALSRLLAADTPPVLVDVLPPSSFHAAHIKGAINIPVDAIESLQKKLPKDRKIITYCASKSCHLSTLAADKLLDLGYKDVAHYAGGLADWEAAGLPLVNGKKRVSFIDREELQRLIREDENLVVVDTLPAEHFKKLHIRGAINIPLADLNKNLHQLAKDATIVTYCANYVCQASSKAAELLLTHGYRNVHDFKGGVHEWHSAGLPIGGTSAK